MYKVYCLNNISKVGLAKFSDEYEIVDSPDDADVFLVRSANMHEMDIPKSLKAVARAGAGTNNIPLDKLAASNIPVFNTPGANSNAVKELVIAGMLLASRDIVGGIEWVRANSSDADIAKSVEKAKKAFAGCEISGKTLGIIGLGAIGRKMAVAADALGMEVVGYDPYLGADAAKEVLPSMKYTSDIEGVWSACDYITLHVPANDSTRGMVDSQAFSKMKDGVVLLNFARDVLVNDEDLAAALDGGKVSRYVTDFANPAVVKMEHAIVVPHLGASTKEAEDNCATMAVEEVMDYLEHGELRHCVNMK